MDTYDAIIKKRDRRHFLPTPIPDDTLRRILQAGRMAGSSKNSQPNRFVVVRDRETLERMAAMVPVGKWLASAAAAIAFVQEGRAHGFDAGRAAQNMMLAAFAEGVGSCPAHLPEAALAKMLGVPEGMFLDRVIGFGYVDPERDRPPLAVARRRLPLEEIVHWDRWQAPPPTA